MTVGAPILGVGLAVIVGVFSVAGNTPTTHHTSFDELLIDAIVANQPEAFTDLRWNTECARVCHQESDPEDKRLHQGLQEYDPSSAAVTDA